MAIWEFDDAISISFFVLFRLFDLISLSIVALAAIQIWKETRQWYVDWLKVALYSVVFSTFLIRDWFSLVSFIDPKVLNKAEFQVVYHIFEQFNYKYF